jgi:hypothetical protein
MGDGCGCPQRTCRCFCSRASDSAAGGWWHVARATRVSTALDRGAFNRN